MTEAEVLQLINDFIVANGNNEITADVLRPILVAILEQPNDFIGDLSQLQTVENTNLVGAINEVYDMFGSISDAGIRLYQGIDDPNDTPTAEYNIADFYIQKDAFNNPVDLWQYNGLAWVKQLTIGQIINDSMTALDSTWSSTKIESEIASAGTIPTLQQVTDEGSTTTNEINANGGVTINGSGSEALKLNSNNINFVDVDGNSTLLSANPDASPNVALLLPIQDGTLALQSEISKRTETFRFCFVGSINANTSWLAYDRGTSILYPTTIVPDTYDNVTRVINEARSAGYSVPYNCKIKRIYWQSGTISNPITINVHTWQATSSTSSNNITVGSKTIAASTGGQLYEFTGSEIDLATTILAGRRISMLVFNNNLSLGQMRFNCLNVEIEEV